MSPEFRQGEQPRDDDTICVECGQPADAYASFDDGSGWLCRRCCERDELVQMRAMTFDELFDYAFAPGRVATLAEEANEMIDARFAGLSADSPGSTE